jgi:hypothetical protein
MSKATDWLRRVKERPTIPPPDEPEELKDLLARIDTQGKAAELKVPQHYFEAIAKGRVVLRLIHHAFLSPLSDAWTVRLFWLAEGGAFALKLTRSEAEEFAELWKIPELLRRMDRPVGFEGFGPFVVADLLPGEAFLDERGESFLVCRGQTQPEWVECWRYAESIHAKRIVLRPSATIFVATEDLERRVKRRIAGRQRRKGA